MSSQGVFYVTGRGGSLVGNLGTHLSERYGLLGGIGLSHTWLRQRHEDQVALVLECMEAAEAYDAPVIANSYGAYLALLAIFSRSGLENSVLLLSPVLGKTVLGGIYHRPAGSKFFAAAIGCPIEKPHLIELYMGDADPCYVPDTWDRLLNALGPDYHALFPGEGHGLRQELVAEVIEQFVRRHQLRSSTGGAPRE